MLGVKHSPFLELWSWQFSKVQGPQALHEETSHSTGHGMWHSWVVLGEIPEHRSLFTGRDTVKKHNTYRNVIRKQMNSFIFSHFVS